MFSSEMLIFPQSRLPPSRLLTSSRAKLLDQLTSLGHTSETLLTSGNEYLSLLRGVIEGSATPSAPVAPPPSAPPGAPAGDMNTELPPAAAPTSAPSGEQIWQ